MQWLSELERMKSAGGTPARPFVTAAFAISRDGCLTRTRGESTLISGPESQRVTHQLRAVHDALVVGVGTVLADDPALTTRLVEGPSPLRIVLDSQLRVPASARLLRSTARAAWLVTSAPMSGERARLLCEAGADLMQVPPAPEGVSIPALLSLLASAGVGSLMLEGGAAVLESFFRARAIDYIALTISPHRLANPCAVRLGESTRTVLDEWRARSARVQLGVDSLETGPLSAAAREASRPLAPLAAQ
jgi:riboflavin-specific deaminase-like protein